MKLCREHASPNMLYVKLQFVFFGENVSGPKKIFRSWREIHIPEIMSAAKSFRPGAAEKMDGEYLNVSLHYSLRA